MAQHYSNTEKTSHVCHYLGLFDTLLTLISQPCQKKSLNREVDFRSVSRMSEVVGYYMVTIKGIVRNYTVNRLLFLLEIIEVIDSVHCV